MTESSSQSGIYRARSAAVEALEHALQADKNGVSGSSPLHLATRVPSSGSEAVLPLPKDVPQLPVVPVTMIPSKASPGHNKTICVNASLIAYGLAVGHIRVIHRSGARALLRGPKELVCDIKFWPGGSGDTVVAGVPSGDIFVWTLQLKEDGEIESKELFSGPAYSGALERNGFSLRLSPVGRTLSVASAPKELSVFEFQDDGSVKRVSESSGIGLSSSITSLVAVDSGHCVVGLEDGSVHLVESETWTVGASWSVPHSTVSPITSLSLLPQRNRSAMRVLLAGWEDNCRLQLLNCIPGKHLEAIGPQVSLDDDTARPYHLSQVAGTLEAGESPLFLLSRADSKLLALRVSGEAAGARFSSAAWFGISQPILSGDALILTDPSRIQVSAVQCTAVQQYTLDLAQLQLEAEQEEEEEGELRIDDGVCAPSLPDVVPHLGGKEREKTTAVSSAVSVRNLPAGVPTAILRPNAKENEEKSAAGENGGPTRDATLQTGGAEKRESPRPEVQAEKTDKTVVSPSSTSDVAVEEAIRRAMEGSHRKFVGHVSLMFKELLKTVHAELQSMRAVQQQSAQDVLQLTLTELRALVAAEREKALAEERERTRQALEEVSSALRDQVAAVAAAAATQSVREVVREELNSHTTSLINSSLPLIVQESFATAFSKRLVPGFEAACSDMLRQLSGSIAAGMESQGAALVRPLRALEEAGSSVSSAAKALAVAAQSSVVGAKNGPHYQVSSSLERSGNSTSEAETLRGELRKLLKSGRLEEAFTLALSANDVGALVWLCRQPVAGTALAAEPAVLSQVVLLSTVQQLATDLADPRDRALKAGWLQSAALALDARDPVIAPHAAGVLREAHAALAGALAGAARDAPQNVATLRLAAHVVRSQLSQLEGAAGY